MDYEIVNEDVLHFPEYFRGSDQLVSFFEDTVSYSVPEWTPWFSGGDDTPEQYGEIKLVDRSRIHLDSPETKDKVSDHINSHDASLIEAFLVYLKHLGTSNKNIEAIKDKHLSSRPPSFTLKKYYKSKSLGPHPDWGDKTPAVFTVAIYLSDKYEGGVLHFPTIEKEIYLTKGSVVVFPSIYVHGSTEIVSGTKYLTNEIIFVDVELLDGRNVYANL